VAAEDRETEAAGGAGGSREGVPRIRGSGGGYAAQLVSAGGWHDPISTPRVAAMVEQELAMREEAARPPHARRGATRRRSSTSGDGRRPPAPKTRPRLLQERGQFSR